MSDEQFRMVPSEYERGFYDAVEGRPAKDGQSTRYNAGYAFGLKGKERARQLGAAAGTPEETQP